MQSQHSTESRFFSLLMQSNIILTGMGWLVNGSTKIKSISRQQRSSKINLSKNVFSKSCSPYLKFLTENVSRIIKLTFDVDDFGPFMITSPQVKSKTYFSRSNFWTEIHIQLAVVHCPPNMESCYCSCVLPWKISFDWWDGKRKSSSIATSIFS